MKEHSKAEMPPGPRGLPLLGHYFEFRRDPLRFVSRMAESPADVVGYRLGNQEVVLLKHPDHIRDVLVTHQRNFAKGRGLEWAKRFLGDGLLTSEGEFHTRQRRLSQPAFHKQRIAAYGSVMAGYAARMRENWREGLPLDASHEMARLTLAVVGKTLFGFEVEGEADAIGRSLTAILRLFHRFTLPFAGVLDSLPLPSTIGFRRAKAHLDETVYRIIAERRRVGAHGHDLLSMLLLAQDEEGDGERMTDLQLRDEAMTLFLAGHETTANALTWTWYLLSQNPEAEARLHEELDEVLSGRLPGVDDLPNLKRTESVFAESLRLYPPAWGLGRRVLEDYPVGDYCLKAGSIVHLSPFTTHRDPRWFPNPLAFDLERWSPEARASRPRFSYFPFGGGARQCIGEPFAWMEGVLLLATLAQRWRLRLLPGHPVRAQALMTLRPRSPVWMVPERRLASSEIRRRVSMPFNRADGDEAWNPGAPKTARRRSPSPSFWGRKA
jgi:cytochrome P450